MLREQVLEQLSSQLLLVVIHAVDVLQVLTRIEQFATQRIEIIAKPVNLVATDLTENLV